MFYERLFRSGSIELAVLFVVVWSSWIDTAWATGWVAPTRTPVVLLMVMLTLAGPVMGISLLDALTTSGETSAVAYVAMQLSRSAFMVSSFGLREDVGRNYAHVLAWSALSGAAGSRAQ